MKQALIERAFGIPLWAFTGCIIGIALEGFKF